MLTMISGLSTSGSLRREILQLVAADPSQELRSCSSLSRAWSCCNPQSRPRLSKASCSLSLISSHTGDSGVLQIRARAKMGAAVLPTIKLEKFSGVFGELLREGRDGALLEVGINGFFANTFKCTFIMCYYKSSSRPLVMRNDRLDNVLVLLK